MRLKVLQMVRAGIAADVARRPTSTAYICHEIEYVAEKQPHLARACVELRAEIEAGIAPHSTFDVWLMESYNGGKYLTGGGTYETANYARLAWLDKLISQEQQ